MLQFQSDYLEGCHPAILDALSKNNFVQTPGYGKDDFCARAKKKILQACGIQNREVFFLSGGTQANATVIDGLLNHWQGVLCAETGHIETHEAGAIEASGHKVITLPQHNGKLLARDVDTWIENFFAGENHEHEVEAGAVYISHPSEYGTIYTKAELENLSAVCKKHRIPLFMDGARLGYALAANGNDVDLKTIAKLCDVFYIGGTKVGALFGEAVVMKKNLIPHFFTLVKKHGALLAKGRVLGLQFETLFTNNLYVEIAKSAVREALFLKKEMQKKGYKTFIASPTNQQFFIVENKKLKAIEKKVGFEKWQVFDKNKTVIRLATSWATRHDDVARLLNYF